MYFASNGTFTPSIYITSDLAKTAVAMDMKQNSFSEIPSSGNSSFHLENCKTLEDNEHPPACYLIG